MSKNIFLEYAEDISDSDLNTKDDDSSEDEEDEKYG